MVEKPMCLRRIGILILLAAIVGGCFGAVTAAPVGDTAPTQTPVETTDPAEPNENKTYLSDSTSTPDAITPSAVEGDDTFAEGTQLSVTVVPVGESFGPNETMTIFVGSFNGSDTPTVVANEQVTVTVERPDGTTETFDGVTNSDGTLEIAYDLSSGNRSVGTYSISVTSPNVDDEATISPTVGTGISPAARSYERVLIGEETTAAFLVRDGTGGVTQEPVTVTVMDPTGTVVEEQQTTTDADGFVSIPFTPQTDGQYDITAEVQETGVSTTQTVSASDVLFRTDYELTRAVAGEDTSYGGYLLDSDGLLGDETVSVEIVNPETDATIADETITTDSSGFFSVDYQPSTSADLRAIITAADGQVIVEDFISVDEPQASDQGVELTADFTENYIAPGDEATLQVEATNEGSPIANQQVTVFPRLGYNGVAVEPQTATTNTTGEARVQLTIPEEAESGNINGVAYIQYNGETIHQSLYGPVEQYAINFDVEDVAPGDEATFSVEVTNRTTDTAVSGVPLQYNGLYSGSGLDSYETGELVTGQSGTDSTTVTVPENLSPDRAVNYMSRYASPTLYRVNMYDFPGSMEITSNSETEYGRPVAAPGEELGVDFTTPDGAAATGLVFAEFSHSADSGVSGSVIEPISASQDGTLTIPDYAGNDSYVTVNVWTATPSGEFYAAEQGIEVRSTDSSDGGSSGETDRMVQVTNVNLDPSSVETNTTNNHTLTFDTLNVSDDGNTDTITVTFPDNTLDSANNVRVTDANGNNISITGSPEVINSGNAVTFDVSPDSNANFRDLTVEANVTVDASDVSTTTETTITVEAVDSGNGQDTAETTLTIQLEDTGSDNLADYTNENGVVGATGLQDAAADFRSGNVDSDILLDAAAAFRAGDPVS
ncbi:hypothetical protein PM022_12520 [Halorubrum ezzemoulense]|uniref:hypothetical protein n=1 Tax=Halorubrum ezzemoulense TaxID=337243 RepID=UPI00232A8F3F|nr:hypothetical protein [Halorubrum ezzemoulense]MDB2275354.1 hypothetical protein [Halorubrum ezzemoulense]